MKTLILLRHGKADPADFETDDYDRRLTDRGKKNAAEMGVYIHSKLGALDLIYASEACRTQETAGRVAESLDYPTEKIVTEAGLYLVSARRMLKYVREIPSEVNKCLLVAHNPGLTDLINAFGVRLDNLPTASAVCFEFDVEKWADVLADNARFCWKELAR